MGGGASLCALKERFANPKENIYRSSTLENEETCRPKDLLSVIFLMAFHQNLLANEGITRPETPQDGQASSNKHRLIIPKHTTISESIQQSINKSVKIVGDVIEFKAEWQNMITSTSDKQLRTFYQEMTLKICFLPRDVKLLYQSNKTFQRRRGPTHCSVEVDIRIYFHSTSQCLEIVLHIISVHHASTFEKRPQTESGLFIPLPRMYLDYNTLVGCVLNDHRLHCEQELVDQKCIEYSLNLIDCDDDFLVNGAINYVNAHLHMNSDQCKRPPKSQNSFISSVLSLTRSTSAATSPMEEVEVSPYSELEREIRSNLYDHTITFNDFAAVISPLLTSAPKGLVKVEAISVDQIYIACM